MKILQVLFVVIGVAVVSAMINHDQKPPRPYSATRQQSSYVHQQPSYQQPGYPQPSYQQPSYHQPSYPQPSYPQPSYQQPSYQPVYHPPAYQCSHEYFQCPPLNSVYRVDGYGKHTQVYAPNRFYYEHSDPRCYIQCDEAGNAFFRPCPYGQVYNRYLTDYNNVNVCVSDGSGVH